MSRPQFHRRPVALIVATLALALALAVAGCGGGDSSGSGDGGGARPRTDVRVQIVQPAANAVTGPEPTLEVNLIGGTVVERTTGPLNPTEGHIHVTVDGQLVSMAYGTNQKLGPLPPGPHQLQVEYVATDHAPFANRVVAGTLFTVQ